MRTKLEAIGNKARVYAEHVGMVSYEDEIEEFLRGDIPLLLAVARAVVEEQAAMDVYTAAHAEPIVTDADADAFGEAAERLEAAKHRKQAAIAPLLEEEK